MNVRLSIVQQEPQHQEEAKGGGAGASPVIRGEPSTSVF